MNCRIRKNIHRFGRAFVKKKDDIKYSRRTFVPRCLRNVLAKFRENLPILYTLLSHLKRWYSREKLLRVIAV